MALMEPWRRRDRGCQERRLVSDMDLGLEQYLTLVVHTLRHGGEATGGSDLKDIGGYEIIGAKINIYTRNMLHGGVTCWNHGNSPYIIGKTTPWAAGDKAKVEQENLQIRAGLEAYIEGETYAVEQRRMERGDTAVSERGGSVGGRDSMEDGGKYEVGRDGVETQHQPLGRILQKEQK